MSDTKVIDNFKKELVQLLSKYKASIDFTFDGDTHGIHNERVNVSFFNGNGFNWEHHLCFGDSLNKREILDE